LHFAPPLFGFFLPVGEGIFPVVRAFHKECGSLDEIEFLLKELEAWGDNDVYGFVVEDCIKSKVHKEYTNSDRDDECYEHEDWEESDSCWGYYGDIDEVKISMFDQAGLDINEFEEENV
jgi:hypothetical protein